MRVLHLAFAGTDQSGVHRKLAEQVSALRAHGAVVESLVVADTRATPALSDAPYRVMHVDGGGFTLPGRAEAFAECLRAAAAFGPDVVYLRYPIYDAEVLRFVCAAPPVVFELQTIFRNEAPPAVAAAEAEWASHVLPMTAGLVAVTGEILDDELARAARVRSSVLPGHVMPNGADPATIPFTAPKLAADRVDLLCVASFHPWHGIDRLIVGFASEPDVHDVHLHLVGDGPTLPALRALVDDAGLSDRVHFHGAVPVASLGPFYERAHVAIGSLAPHRVGLRELAALKHREYVLRGLPMVLAGGDADFTTALPWYRQFVADDSPISPRVLRALALGWSHEGRRRQIRRWAEAHVSWDAKVPGLLRFLEACRVRGAPRREYASA